jgi:ribulose-5-phosphate 4-epimerase/fuculose-1-phosphate aldolase
MGLPFEGQWTTGASMTVEQSEATTDLIAANRILAHEGILDSLGHVSIRHPDDPTRFLLSRARSPELVELSDLLEHDLAGEPIERDTQAPYRERFIHAAVYEARPNVMAVCHSHTPSILPFSISKNVRLRAVVHTGRFLGGEVPVWDIAHDFGEGTDMLVTNLAQGRSLNIAMADSPIALMRGHGCVIASNDLIQLVGMCVGMDRNAHVQLAAATLGDYTPIHEGEYASQRAAALQSPSENPPRGDNRAWEYYRRRAGVL